MLPQVLFTATPFRADRLLLPMQVLDYSRPTEAYPGPNAKPDLKLKLRIQQGYCRNVAYAPVPIYSAKLSDVSYMADQPGCAQLRL